MSILDPKSVAVVFGTRREAIKLAPVIRELPAPPLVINTGQHRELLDHLLNRLYIEPDVNLDVMLDNNQLSGLTARLTAGLGETLRKHRPEAVIVQGHATRSPRNSTGG